MRLIKTHSNPVESIMRADRATQAEADTSRGQEGVRRGSGGGLSDPSRGAPPGSPRSSTAPAPRPPSPGCAPCGSDRAARTAPPVAQSR
eukprot:5017174-Pyramimonas_sp.AAC.1